VLTNTGLTNIEEASQEDEKMQIDEPSDPEEEKDIEMLPMRRQGAGRPLVDEEKSTSVSEALCSEMGYLHISQS